MPREAQIEIIPVEASVLRIEPGDTLVLSLRERITDAMCEALVTKMRELFPGVPIIVLDRGATLQVARTEAGDG